MSDTKITVRMSKSTGFYNKSNNYKILLNNEVKTKLNYVDNREVFNVKSGKNIVEIKNKNTTIIKEVNIKNGQDVTLTINASVTYKLGLGIMVGIAIAGLIIQIIVANKVILPLVFIPFIPLLLVKKENFPNSFEITSNE
jgi:hypothetical protein